MRTCWFWQFVSLGPSWGLGLVFSMDVGWGGGNQKLLDLCMKDWGEGRGRGAGYRGESLEKGFCWFNKKKWLRKILNFYVHKWMSTCLCTVCMRGQKKVSDSLEPELQALYSALYGTPLCVGAGNRTAAISKSIKSSSPLSRPQPTWRRWFKPWLDIKISSSFWSFMED